MKKSTQYIFVGCGSCLALVVIAVVGLIVGGAHLTQETMEPFEGAVEIRQTLDEKFGEVKDFVPWPAGAVPAARMEAFLTVREATAPAREKLAETMNVIPASAEKAEELDSKPFFEKMRSVLDITKSGFNLGAEMGEFFAARNQGLLEEGMGLGEYTYLYVLVFYVLLEIPEDDSGDGIPMPNMAQKRLHRELRAMLRSQLESLPDEAASAEWKARLSSEVENLDSDPGRLPWEDGLPEVIAASLEPFRERLAASYTPEANPFELARNRRRGRFSIEAE